MSIDPVLAHRLRAWFYRRLARAVMLGVVVAGAAASGWFLA